MVSYPEDNMNVNMMDIKEPEGDGKRKQSSSRSKGLGKRTWKELIAMGERQA